MKLTELLFAELREHIISRIILVMPLQFYHWDLKEKVIFYKQIGILSPYNSRIEELKTPFDWLTRDDKVEKYMLDKYCGFSCTKFFFL